MPRGSSRKSGSKNSLMQLLCVVVIVFVAYLLYKNMEGFQNGAVIILYYNPGCPHCVNFMPTWNKFEASNPPGVEVNKVNVSEDRAAGQAANIQGVPTVKLEKANGEILEYNGPRTVDGLTEFCNQNA